MNKIITNCSLLFLLHTTAFAAPVIHKMQTFYKIKGNTAQDLRNEMNNLGPIINNHHYDAKNSWHVQWQYKWYHDNWHYDDPSQSPCYATKVKVSVVSTTLIPEWVNQNSSNISLQNQWNTYLAALKNHEEGHESNGIEAAAEVEVALLNIPPMPNCRELKIALDNTAKRIIRQHNNWDARYDTDTDHGKTQGVIFP